MANLYVEMGLPRELPAKSVFQKVMNKLVQNVVQSCPP